MRFIMTIFGFILTTQCVLLQQHVYTVCLALAKTHPAHWVTLLCLVLFYYYVYFIFNFSIKMQGLPISQQV